ncbi:MAG: hypothetical protein ABR564_03335 [Candidatus Dormibacteria bacterium]
MSTLTAVRFVHYLAGIAWVGASLVLAIVVFPAIDRCPGQVRAPIMRALAARIAPWETVAATTVILSGGIQAALQHRLDQGWAILSTRWGQGIGVGLLCALLLIALGLSVLAPLTRRFTELESTVALDGERSALSIRELGRADPVWWGVRRRLVMATTAEISIALVAIFSMAVARGA